MTTRKREQQNAASPEGGGRNPLEYGEGASTASAARTESVYPTENLMEAVVERRNMWQAYDKVVGNKGASGVDGMTVYELGEFLRTAWPGIKEELLAGSYRPQPVLGVRIPKPGGGVRQLGIPTVVDRLIQQAIQQILTPPA